MLPYMLPKSDYNIPRIQKARKVNLNVILNDLIEKGYVRSDKIYNSNNNIWAYTRRNETLLVQEKDNGTGKIIQRTKKLSFNYK